MNLRSFDKSTRLLEQANLTAHGMTMDGENDVLVLGIINCTQNSDSALMHNLVFGVRKANGVALTFNLTNLNYLSRLAPATAKYTRNYIDTVAKNTQALIHTNLLDGVIAVVDNYVMGLGVLEGCTRSNCPVILMPTGINPNYCEDLFNAPGKIATREIKANGINQVIHAYAHQAGTAPTDTLSIAFFQLAQAFNLMLPGACDLHFGTGATLNFALTTAAEAVQRADDIITTKRLINKKTLTENLAQYQANGGNATGWLLFQNLLNMVDLKAPVNLFTSLKGLGEQAYVVSNPTAPLNIQGQAWVYRSLTDAITALCSNAIDQGVVVLQNCVDCDVSLIAKTITALQKTDCIALLTDGYCAATSVLTVANVTPHAFDNQDFANLQNGDIIEIDVAKGRLSVNVSSKDMKLRAKRNITKKHEIYF